MVLHIMDNVFRRHNVALNMKLIQIKAGAIYGYSPKLL
jgi:hypothetical protein